MQRVPQIEPVSQLQRNYKTVLEKLDAGPVFLSSQGRAAAVMVSVAQWQETAERLALYERQIAGDEAVAADNWVSAAEVDETFATMGIGADE